VSGPTVLSCRVGLSRDPHNPALLAALAQLLLDAGRALEAEPVLRELLEQDPARPGLRTALGNALKGAGRFQEAEAAYRAALELDPADVPARYNAALLALLQGRLEEGWEGRELRWLAGGARPRTFAEPAWDGGPLEGRTLLLHGAQEGFGDAIMALRYAKLARGGRVVVECHPALAELFRTFPAEIIPFGEPLPPFHCQALLMSLPRVFRTGLATIPWPGPYLRAPGPVPDLGGGFKVGLVHAGNPDHPDDAARSIPPECLERLAALRPRCRFFSLQKTRDPALAPLPASLGAVDLGEAMDDFAATANLLAALDLIVSVDTAVVHLAGAMGRPGHLLLPFEPDWRWLLDRDDSPWYPTLRLHRQTVPGDWDGVLQALTEELAHGA
jgi:tetratricopeptide (TPR) repeat protein